MVQLQGDFKLFCQAFGMEPSFLKSLILQHGLENGIAGKIQQMMQFKMVNLEDGMKYLGYFLNHNHYIKEDWLWLIRKVKKRIYHWFHRELSLGGRLILVKLVLDIILVYCLSLENTPKLIMKIFRQKCFQSLWIGKKRRIPFG